MINIKIKNGRDKWEGFLELTHAFGSTIRNNDANGRILTVPWISRISRISRISGMRYILYNTTNNRRFELRKRERCAKTYHWSVLLRVYYPHIFVEGYPNIQADIGIKFL